MFVKFVRHIVGHGVSDSKGRFYGRVVPSESTLLEVSKIAYRKMSAETPDKLQQDIGSLLEEFSTQATVMQASEHADADSDSLGTECIIAEVFKMDGSREIIVAIDCRMFIMNDDGKTVEAVISGSY